jgi:short-subunit dehydrogenase
LDRYGVSVTALCPGSSETSFGEVAGQKISAYLRLMMTTPERVARAGVAAMFARRAAVIPGVLNKVAVFFGRLTPRSVQSMIVGKVISG